MTNSFEQTIYRELPVPKDLSFDEESLFWRLRLGEGMPSREWHKPLDRQKTWHEIKSSLDSKLHTKRAAKIFQKIYPGKNFLFAWLGKALLTIKMAFLLTD